MIKFTSQEIQDQFHKLPGNVQIAITSPDVHEKIETIAKKYSLHIDQLGELVDEIGLVLLGLENSKDFVVHTAERLGVTSKVSVAIAQDVNTYIFGTIKKYMQDTEEQVIADNDKDTTIADIERLGGFSIDPHPVITPTHIDEQGTVSMDASKALSEFEKSIETAPKMPSSSQQNFTEPLIDHLLSTASISIPPLKPEPYTPTPSINRLDVTPQPPISSVIAPTPPNPPPQNSFTGPLSEKIAEKPQEAVSPADKVKPDGGKPAFDPYRELIK